MAEKFKFRNLVTAVCIFLSAVVLYIWSNYSVTESSLSNRISTENNRPFPKIIQDQDHVLPNMTSYFSFVDQSTHNCEDIFENPSNKEKKLSELEVLINETNMYNEVVAAVGRNLSKVKGTCSEGYTFKYLEEVYVTWMLFRADFVQTICETGFNLGHSALQWLLMKPDIKVYSFDINRHKCTAPMAEYLTKKYPDRLKVIFGDSTKALPAFRKANPDVRCDVAIIDGGHTHQVSQQDSNNFFEMTGRLNFVFLDNYPDARFYDKLSYTWENEKIVGRVHELFRCKYKKKDQGFTFGYYVH